VIIVREFYLRAFWALAIAFFRLLNIYLSVVNYTQASWYGDYHLLFGLFFVVFWFNVDFVKSELESKCRAFSYLWLYIHFAIENLTYLLTNRKSKADSSFVLLRSRLKSAKQLEELFLLFLWDADSGVFNWNCDGAFLSCDNAILNCFACYNSTNNRYCAFISSIFDCVWKQIQQGLLEAHLVRLEENLFPVQVNILKVDRDFLAA